MPLAIRKGGLCAFCSFRTSQPLRRPLNRPHGLRYRSTSDVQLQRIESALPIRRIGQYGGSSTVHLDRRGRATGGRGNGDNRPRTHGTEGRSHGPWSINRRQRPNLQVPTMTDTGLVDSNETTYDVFGRLLLEQTHRLEFTLRYKEKASVEAWGIKTDEELDEKLAFFKGRLKACTDLAEQGKVHKQDNPLFQRMRYAFITGGISALGTEMKYSFFNEVLTASFTPHHQANQEKLADLRYPLEWYPATRALQRTVHLHVGPTNSGKTYHALQRLEAAESGIYAGPLRLLAHEVYTRLNAKGKACALVTGEERRIPENYNHTMNSCTVEMVPLNAKVDVAVIDEIQMMGDTERGWAWTQAFLGVQAKEVHLCGETRTKKIITDLCAAMGDKLVVHEYERLSPLKTQNHSLERLENLEKGDAIILFSRVAIHAMKADVERVTGKRCAVVYGSLPPETRAQQAALFNDPNNDYDFLVASDAVGMGLNLSIKRVIFESTSKHDGVSFRTIMPYEIKQIAGRAGRYKTAQEAINKGNLDNAEPLALDTVKNATKNMGYVTTISKFDLGVVQQAMEMEVEPLASVGIFPPADILHRFASYFPPKTPFGYIVMRLHDMASLQPQFHLCRLKEQIQIVDLVQEFDLSHMDRITLMSSPASLRDPGMTKVIKEMAKCIAEQKKGALLDMECFDLELIDKDIHDDVDGSKGYLRKAEALHRAVTLYLWLSYRFAGIFTSQALGFHIKTLIEEKIDQCLAEVSWTEAQRKKLNYLRMKAAKAAARKEELTKAAAISFHAEDSGVSHDSASVVLGAEIETGNNDPDEQNDNRERDLTEDEAEAALNGEDAAELKAACMEAIEQEGHDSEDSPASDGNIPTTPQELEVETGGAYDTVAPPTRDIEKEGW
ncbi:P-loop containing nucleoside triphosphate hydrolase protein [Rhexocercosporidium sp. MPI-PUGE-AT-0058]|nr:P-loop containing nucleoside triphosphate hydrolase protein [Rhexocercosporidium sp. MPI-PUGE-AT-0058]